MTLVPEPKPLLKRIRLPIGRTPRRLTFERRVRFWLTGLALPALVAIAVITHLRGGSWLDVFGAALGLAVLWTIASAYFYDQLIRPLQTLTNVVSALREDDFSFRARGGRRGDALGDLALEINALASTLQHQRTSALDAVSLVERVLTSMQSPVLAFDHNGFLRLVNAAARAEFALQETSLIGRHVSTLGLGPLLDLPDQGLYSESALSPKRWSVRKATFRLHGLPHTLLVLADVAAALREEERIAWQRLIRVLGHEISNSLTPIKSIAGTLRSRLTHAPAATGASLVLPDFERGLRVIEDRSESLNRFLQAYQRLSRLPAPELRIVSVEGLIAQVAHLETRLTPSIRPGPPARILCDPDQIQQALINLLRNATEAALSIDTGQLEAQTPEVVLSWFTTDDQLTILVEDNGPGISNPVNLFVPFYTTKPQGSGIGLVLAQSIATAHGGLVTLAAAATHTGCLAKLVLPLTPPPSR